MVREYIQSLENEKNVFALIDELNDFPDIDVIAALGHIGDERAVEPLIEVLNNTDDDDTHEYIIKALGYIKGEKVVKPLIKALDSTNSYNRTVAAQAFIWISDERAVAPLIKTLKDTDWNVRYEATRALGSIGNQSSVEPLKEAALNDSNQNVRISARRALKSMNVEISNVTRVENEGNAEGSNDSFKTDENVHVSVKSIGEKRFIGEGVTFYYPENWQEIVPGQLFRADIGVELFVSKREVISQDDYDFYVDGLVKKKKYWDLEDYVESEKEPYNINGEKTIISGEYINIAGVRGYRQDTIEQNILNNTIERVHIFFVKNRLKYELDFQTKFISSSQSNIHVIEDDIKKIVNSCKISI